MLVQRGKSRSRRVGLALFLLSLVSAAPGQIPFTPKPLIIGMGDSFGAGVQSADANWRTQSVTYLSLLANEMGSPLSLPSIQSSPWGVAGSLEGRSRLFPSYPASNLAVPGAGVHELLHERADAVKKEAIDSEADLILFPRLGSPVEIVEVLSEIAENPLIICWIGNYDVLPAVLSFDQLDASQMTSGDDFRENFMEIVKRLSALQIPLVFANIPDVTRIGFLLDRDDLKKFLGENFILAEGALTSLITFLLIKLGFEDTSLLANPNFVLDATEVEQIRARVAIFNEIIEEVTDEHKHPVVDLNALFGTFASDPPTFADTSLSLRFQGGVFSLDGIHPSNIAHALIANAFIAKINEYFQTTLSPISETTLTEIFLSDPFIDRDGDGTARGQRFNTGLLETLGPFLGLSGDVDDLKPTYFSLGIDPHLGESFRRKLQILQRQNPRGTASWIKGDMRQVFGRLFGFQPTNDR